uniref:D-isomer specific 2-hydroxyacid dehydrogenase NAD-binding domain-containing protein n=1 Tax=Solanum lycopersicum TaxID=4081 RepID=A0A3Q7F4Z8_SOLLC
MFQDHHFPLGSKVGSRNVGIVVGYHINRGIKSLFLTHPFYGDVHELATKCDVLVICCSLTERTRHFIHKEILLGIGNEMELVKCLEEGEIAGAGLDAFDNEPKELLSMDNVVLATYECVCANLEAFFLNNPLITSVLDN